MARLQRSDKAHTRHIPIDLVEVRTLYPLCPRNAHDKCSGMSTAV